MLVRRRTPSFTPALLLLALLSLVIFVAAFSSVASARMTPPVLYVPDGQGDDTPWVAPPRDDQIGLAPNPARPAVLPAEWSSSSSEDTISKRENAAYLRALLRFIFTPRAR